MYNSLWETHRKNTERHLPYEITQCYLKLPDRLVLDLSTPEGWKLRLCY